MIRIFLYTLATAVVLQNGMTAAGAQTASRFWWMANILDAGNAEVGSVFYGAPRELVIQLWLKNEAGDRRIMVPSGFRELVTFELRKEGRPVDVTVGWDPQTRQLPSGIITGGASDLLLEHDADVEALCEIRRKDGDALESGSYVLFVSITSLRKQLRFDDGEPWAGHLNTPSGIPFEVRLVKSQVELTMSATLAARASFRKGNYGEAIQLYRKLISVDPSEPAGHTGLGQAYFALEQYPQAIAAFEQALSLVGNRPSPLLVYPLAYAYVATGQEPKASDILKLLLPADKIPAELGKYRTRARQAR